MSLGKVKRTKAEDFEVEFRTFNNFRVGVGKNGEVFLIAVTEYTLLHITVDLQTQ